MKLHILTEHKRRTVEQTACWYTEIELKPGEYEIYCPEGSLKYFRYARVPGVITKEHYPSGFGGMYYANPNDGKNVGNETVYVMKLPDSCDDPENEYGRLGRERFNEYNEGKAEIK